MVDRREEADQQIVIASIAFIGISAVLFLYWFRYTCLMILSSRPADDFARATADAHGLGFEQVQASLQDGVPYLDALQARLDADYAVVLRVMREYEVKTDALEATMLRAHYAVVRVFCRAMTYLAPTQARAALAQMADTIAHFAAIIGEQAAST